MQRSRRRPGARLARLALALFAAAGLVLAAASGCALRHTWVAPGALSVAAAPVDSVDCTLLFVGDAGKPDLEAPEPVLEALCAEASGAPSRTLVVFLGDNVYPDGLPAAGAADRPRAEAVLRRQADVVRRSGAHGLFVPGNHDYHLDGREGVQRQAAYIASLGVPGLEYRPAGDCPGPESFDLGRRLRLVVFDSTWWIHDEFAAPAAPDCKSGTEASFVAALDSVLAEAGDRTVVIATHHPVASHGWHGGFFTWQDHLFPLTRMVSWLWLPLPGLGSLYPLYRQSGAVRQDISNSHYQHMLAQLEQAFVKRPPLALAAGHDHNLQVLAGQRGVRYALVSGAGSIARPDPVSYGDDTICASPSPGFMRLDLLHDGRARLEVVEVGEGGGVTRPWSGWLGVPAPSPVPLPPAP